MPGRRRYAAHRPRGRTLGAEAPMPPPPGVCAPGHAYGAPFKGSNTRRSGYGAVMQQGITTRALPARLTAAR